MNYGGQQNNYQNQKIMKKLTNIQIRGSLLIVALFISFSLSAQNTESNNWTSSTSEAPADAPDLNPVYPIDWTPSSIDEQNGNNSLLVNDVILYHSLGKLYLEFFSFNIYDIHITAWDVAGRNIISSWVYAGEGKIKKTYNLNTLAPGVYILRLDAQQGSYTKKFYLQ